MHTRGCRNDRIYKQVRRLLPQKSRGFASHQSVKRKNDDRSRQRVDPSIQLLCFLSILKARQFGALLQFVENNRRNGVGGARMGFKPRQQRAMWSQLARLRCHVRI